MEIVIPIIAAVVGVAAGAGGIFAYNKKNEKGGKDKADDLVRKAKREAQDIVLSAGGSIDSYGWNPADCLHQGRENRLLFQIQYADEYYSDFIGSLGMYTP